MNGDAGGFDLFRQLVAEDALPRTEIERLRNEMARPCAPVGFTRRAVRPRGRRGTDLDAEIVLFGDRLLWHSATRVGLSATC